jgi:hypothetical protein
MNNNWIKINSDDFKHQYYHKNFQIISKIDKEKKELVDLIGQYTKDKKILINKFRTISEAAKKTGSNSSHISSCTNGKKNCITHNGFVWKKLENQESIPKTDDEIKEELNKNIIKGHERHGEINLTVIRENGERKQVRLHRFIYYIYHERKISGCIVCGKDPSVFCVFDTKHDIDHFDKNHTNNDPKNLQRMCASCHSKKTNEQTRSSGERKCCSDKKKVKLNVYKNGGKEIFRTFDSIEECMKEIETSHKTIRRSMERKEYSRKLKDGNKYLFEEIIDVIESEIWKDIPSEIGKGQCSNKGRIKTGKKIVTYGNLKNDYLLVNGKRVHIIIAKTFLKDEYEKKALEIQEKFPGISIDEIKNSTGKPYSIMVDHIDRNPINNCLDNLRWVSVQENNLNKKNVKEVEQWSLDGKILINTFPSQKEVSEKFGVSSSEISCAISGYRGIKQLKGSIFKFKGEDIESVKSEEEKSYEIFTKHFEKFKKFIIEHKRTPYQRKDELGIWYNSMKQHYKNKTACMSYPKIYDLWNDFVNKDENKQYFLDWNDTWLINFNKIPDLFNNKLSDEMEIKKIKEWMRKQNYNYKNKVKSMSDKNKEQFDKWTELINSGQITI